CPDPTLFRSAGGEGNRASSATTEDSPAARARASRVGVEPVAAPEPEPRRRRWRPIALAFILVAAIVASGCGFYYWTQQQYYVGAANDGTVAVFQGISAEIGPLHLSSAVESADIKVEDLTEVARGQVRAGIDATSLDDARQIIDRLQNSQLPGCSDLIPSPTPTPSVSAPVTPSVTPTPTLTGIEPPASPSTSPSASASASASNTPVPGVDCRDNS
ncbi:MAG: protein serine/threonine phosphatase, partial [Pseudonocardiales bacterium]|nr:protein serine/threonine phosphatase [Pseudonocardiales bacterium]